MSQTDDDTTDASNHNTRTITGTGVPSIEACPECGSYKLIGTTVTVNTTTLRLDANGGVAEWTDGAIQDTLVMSLDCGDCGVPLIEDAEPVHEVLQ